MGCQASEALQMPASRFFALLRAAREITFKRESMWFARLCDIGFLSRTEKKSYDKLRESYVMAAVGSKTGRALDASDPRTATIMRSIFKQAARFH